MLTWRLYGGSHVTSSPLSSISPEVGGSKPPIIRRVVVFPQPDGPSSVKNSPDWTSRSMWSTTTFSPYFLTTSTSLTSTVGHGRSHSWGGRKGRGPGSGRGYGRASRRVNPPSRTHGRHPVRDSQVRDLVRDESRGIPRRTVTQCHGTRRSGSGCRGPRPGRAVRYRRFDRQNATRACPKGPTDAHHHRERRHGRAPRRPGARAGSRHRHARDGQGRGDRRDGDRVHDRADDARVPPEGRDRGQRPRGAERDRCRPHRHHVGRDGPARPAPSGGAAASRA